MTGTVFNIQHFSIHDGPGIRSTVFFKGCNLRCFWCHNPESWRTEPEMQFYAARCIGCGVCAGVCPHAKDGKRALLSDDCTACGACAEACMAEAIRLTGKSRTADEVIADLLSDSDLYEKSGGGITFSGGEPLLQPEFLRALLLACRERGWHTAVESAVCVPWERIEALLPLIDLMICDIKTLDEAAHREATGQSNARILDNIRHIAGTGKPLLLRTPIIPGFNDSRESVAAIAEFIAALPGSPALELLPFQSLCKSKYESLHRAFGAETLETPERAYMKELAALAERSGVFCTVNGL